MPLLDDDSNQEITALKNHYGQWDDADPVSRDFAYFRSKVQEQRAAEQVEEPNQP